MLRRLAAPDGNICAIGDPNQAIYGFRGADATCFERFRQDFNNVRTVRLGRNYRSTGTIVTAAAQIIGGGAPSDITRPMLAPITLHAAPIEWAEAEFVAEAIENLLGGHDMLAANRETGVNGGADRPLGFADFAVLYRTDGQSAALREVFDRCGIPFKKSSPAPIAGQPAVQALLAALARQNAGLHGTDLPARIAAASEEVRRAGDGPDAAALAEARRWLAALAGAGDEARLREQVALSTEADFWDARADRVSLLTMHAAKGLEFPVVFVVGLEDGLTPFSWRARRDVGAPDDDAPARREAEAEERRLFYVAMTRAKDRLFLSRAVQRSWRGRLLALPPSRFLRDIADELLARQASPARKARPEARQYSLF